MNKQSEKKPLIVIIEDDKDLADLISKYLENSGMLTQICHDGAHVERFLNPTSLIYFYWISIYPMVPDLNCLNNYEQRHGHASHLFNGRELRKQKSQCIGNGGRRLHHQALRISRISCTHTMPY